MNTQIKHWAYPRMIGHRGAGLLAPENTLAAFKLGYSYGYRMFECDIKLTADDVPYLLHDEDWDRTTQLQGSAAPIQSDELRHIDAGSWHSPEYATEPIPTLQTIANWILANDCDLNIEIKPIPGTQVHTGERVALAAALLWGQSNKLPILSSFSVESLAAAKKVAPMLPRALLVEQLTDQTLDTLYELSCSAVVCHYACLSKAQIDRLKQANYRIMVYTCNDPIIAQQLLEQGVDSVITDAVNLIAP